MRKWRSSGAAFLLLTGIIDAMMPAGHAASLCSPAQIAKSSQGALKPPRQYAQNTSRTGADAGKEQTARAYQPQPLTPAQRATELNLPGHVCTR